MTNTQSNKILSETNTYNRLTITPDEYSRINYGELTELDFCTSNPNPYNIDKTARGINEYLRYKRKHMKGAV